MKFKFENFVAMNVLCMIMAGLFFFVLLEAIKDGYGWGSLLVLIWILFFLFTIIGNIIFSSEICVDERGIRRNFCGILLCDIPWNEVKSVYVVDVKNFGPKGLIRSFSIFPTIKRWPRLLPSGRLGFSGAKMVRYARFVEEMNNYISKYKIVIEYNSEGVTRSVDRIPL